MPQAIFGRARQLRATKSLSVHQGADYILLPKSGHHLQIHWSTYASHAAMCLPWQLVHLSYIWERAGCLFRPHLSLSLSSSLSYRFFAFLARSISFCFARSSFIFSMFFMPLGGLLVTTPVIVFFHTGRPVTCGWVEIGGVPVCPISFWFQVLVFCCMKTDAWMAVVVQGRHCQYVAHELHLGSGQGMQSTPARHHAQREISFCKYSNAGGIRTRGSSAALL